MTTNTNENEIQSEESSPQEQQVNNQDNEIIDEYSKVFIRAEAWARMLEISPQKLYFIVQAGADLYLQTLRFLNTK